MDTEEGPEEEEESEKETSFEDLKPKLYRLVYNQPTVLLSMLEVFFDFLIDRKIMAQEEAEAIMKEGLRRWSESGIQ